MDALSYVLGQEYVESMIILAESNYHRTALICGLSGLEILARIYLNIQTSTKNNPEFISKDFTFTKEKIKNMFSRAEALIKKLQKTEKVSHSDTEIVYGLVEEITAFSEHVVYLKQKLMAELPLQRLRKIWKLLLKFSEKTYVRIIGGTILTIVVGYLFIINAYDFIASRPTYTLYPASLGKDIFISGWDNYSKREKTRWSDAESASVLVHIHATSKDKTLTLLVNRVPVLPHSSVTTTQRIFAYIGNTPIGSASISSGQTVPFIIPNKLITSSNISVTFLFPNAKSLAAFGILNAQGALAVNINGFRLDDVDSAPYFRLGRKISASRKANAKYFVKGWDVPWRDHRWAIEGYSEILLKTPKTNKNLEMKLRIKHVLLKPGILESQRLRIYVNNRFLTETLLTDNTRTVKAEVPYSFFANDKKLLIGFACPDAAVPKILGLWNSNNTVSFALKSITLKQKN